MEFKMIFEDMKGKYYAAIKEQSNWTFYEIESGRDDRDPLTKDELIDIIEAALEQNYKITLEPLKRII